MCNPLQGSGACRSRWCWPRSLTDARCHGCLTAFSYSWESCKTSAATVILNDVSHNGLFVMLQIDTLEIC